MITLIAVPLVAACEPSDEEQVAISGSARLPTCSDPPAVTLTGNWFDSGKLTVKTPGCRYQAGTVVEVCALKWSLTQDGNAVHIVVDDEYRIEGRLCGDRLYLQGGWWLPVENASGACTYADQDAAEVGIEQEGNVLTVSQDRMTGTLVLREACTADYAVTFARRP